MPAGLFFAPMDVVRPDVQFLAGEKLSVLRRRITRLPEPCGGAALLARGMPIWFGVGQHSSVG